MYVPYLTVQKLNPPSFLFAVSAWQVARNYNWEGGSEVNPDKADEFAKFRLSVPGLKPGHKKTVDRIPSA